MMISPEENYDEAIDSAPDLDDRRLLNMINSYLGDDHFMYDEEMELQRMRNYRSYYGEHWGSLVKGRSDYVSHDTFDVCEGTRSIMMEALTSTDAPLSFKPTSADDVLAAEAATKWSYDNFFRGQNEGYKLLDGAIYDGLIAKMATCKVFWRQQEELKEEEFPRMSIQEFSAIFQQHLDSGEVEMGDYTEVVDVQMLPDGTEIEASFIEGTIIRSIDTSYAACELIPPERFIVGENNGKLEDLQFCGEWSIATKSDLLELGFDPEQIEKAQYTGDWDYVNIARHSNDQTWNDLNWQGEKGFLERYKLYELFIRYDMDEDGIDKLYQVWYCGGQLLEINEVDKHIYHTWSSVPLPHRIIGMAQADVIAPLQEQKSRIIRLAIDNMQIANNPTRAVKVEHLKNPRQLVENRIGTNIAVYGNAPPDTITAIPTSPLSPLTFNAIEMLNQDKEERGGYSRLAAGVDPNAMSGQNADRTIEKMTNNSNRRIMKMTRDFVETFYKPIIQDLWALGRINDSEPISVNVNGQQQQITPQDIGERFDLIVNVALTQEEKQKRVQSLMMMNGLFSQWGIMYTDKQKYSLAAQLGKLVGEPDIESILMSPESDEYKQIMQQQSQMQQQQQQQQAQMQQQMQQMQEQQRQFYEQIEGMKAQALVQKEGQQARKTAAEAQNKEIENAKYAETRDIRSPSEANKDFALARKYAAEAEAIEIENDLVETGVDKLINDVAGEYSGEN